MPFLCVVQDIFSIRKMYTNKRNEWKKKWKEMALKRWSTRRTLCEIWLKGKCHVLDLYFVSIFTIHLWIKKILRSFSFCCAVLCSGLFYSALSDCYNCSLSISIVLVGIGVLLVFIVQNIFFCVCMCFLAHNFIVLNFTILFELSEYVLLRCWFIFVSFGIFRSIYIIHSMCNEYDNSNNNKRTRKNTQWYQTKYESQLHCIASHLIFRWSHNI